MKLKWHWSMTFVQTDEPSYLPFVHHCGGAEIDSVDYHESAEFRADCNHVVFQYTLKGEGVIQDSSGVHRVPVGHGFICETHGPEIAYHYPEDATEPWVVCWAVIHGRNSLACCRELVGRFGSVFALSRHEPCLDFIMSRWQDKGRQAWVEQVSGSDAVAMAHGIIHGLMTAGERGRKKSSGWKLIEATRSLIIGHASSRLTVAEIAARLSITPNHLARVFRKELGMGPARFVDEQTMRIAENLLRGGSSVKSVAMDLGYGNPSHFIRTFKRINGVSPGAYRRTVS